MPDHFNSGSNNAAWGGVVLSILGNLHWEDLSRTVILGTLGTVVSFFVSGLLKKITQGSKKEQYKAITKQKEGKV